MPPNALANSTTGVSTSPKVQELKDLARLILDNVGMPDDQFGVNRINRMVIRFNRCMPDGNAWVFYLYLANEVQMSEAQQRAALCNPDIARAISYADPTGEIAMNNVMREVRRGKK